MLEHYTNLEGDDRLIKTTQENVRSQFDHLRTHPSVALLLRKKQVDLHGWVYGLKDGLIKPVCEMKAGTEIDYLYEYDDL